MACLLTGSLLTPFSSLNEEDDVRSLSEDIDVTSEGEMPRFGVFPENVGPYGLLLLSGVGRLYSFVLVGTDETKFPATSQENTDRCLRMLPMRWHEPTARATRETVQRERGHGDTIPVAVHMAMGPWYDDGRWTACEGWW